MSKLLIEEYPLVVLPTLAKTIGLNEAIVLQQMQYWINISKHEHDGKKWVYNSYPEWQKQFPWWCERTIKSIILNLEKMGVVESANYNTMKIDRTKWYTINKDKLDELLENGIPNPTIGNGLPDENEPSASPLPETTTEITTDLQSIITPSELCEKDKLSQNPDTKEEKSLTTRLEETPLPQPLENPDSETTLISPPILENLYSPDKACPPPAPPASGFMARAVKPECAVPVKEPPLHKQLFSAVSTACNLSAHSKTSGSIGAAASYLVESKCAPDDVLAFAKWWRSDVWRSEHTPLKPHLIIQNIGDWIAMGKPEKVTPASALKAAERTTVISKAANEQKAKPFTRELYMLASGGIEPSPEEIERLRKRRMWSD